MRRLIFAAATLALLPQLAFALSLNEAKDRGLVGERQDGYLGVISGGSEAEALARDINNQRRAVYQSSAAKNGTSQQAVEIVAGQKAQSLTPSGQYIQGSNGAWVKK